MGISLQLPTNNSVRLGLHKAEGGVELYTYTHTHIQQAEQKGKQQTGSLHFCCKRIKSTKGSVEVWASTVKQARWGQL